MNYLMRFKSILLVINHRIKFLTFGFNYFLPYIPKAMPIDFIAKINI